MARREQGPAVALLATDARLIERAIEPDGGAAGGAIRSSPANVRFLFVLQLTLQHIRHFLLSSKAHLTLIRTIK